MQCIVHCGMQCIVHWHLYKSQKSTIFEPNLASKANGSSILSCNSHLKQRTTLHYVLLNHELSIISCNLLKQPLISSCVFTGIDLHIVIDLQPPSITFNPGTRRNIKVVEILYNKQGAKIRKKKLPDVEHEKRMIL